MKVKVEIKDYKDEDTGFEYRALFVDGVVFDWGMDNASLLRAKKFARNKLYEKSIIGDIQKHFLECFSEFIGQKVTLKDVINAIESGEIEIVGD